MIWRLGPVTVMSTSIRDAYAVLANAAYRLHQRIWYAGDLSMVEHEIRDLDMLMSDAISRTPPEDIQVEETA